MMKDEHKNCELIVILAQMSFRAILSNISMPSLTYLTNIENEQHLNYTYLMLFRPISGLFSMPSLIYL